MDDAGRRVFGFFEKIVKRDKKPKDLAKDIFNLLEQIKIQIQNNPEFYNNSYNASSSSNQPLASPLSIPTPSPFHLITSEFEQTVYMIYGDSSEGVSTHKEPDPKQAKEVIELFFENDFIHKFLDVFRYLEFEGRKYFVRIFEYCFNFRKDLSVGYIEEKPFLLQQLVAGYDEKDVSTALSFDAMLRAVIQCEDLCETFLNMNPSLVQPFFRYVELPSFDINSHAFSTFKLIILAHPELGANYLRENYEQFFTSFNKLLLNENFLTKVQCFNFLGEILASRPNHDVMMKYVNDLSNLKLAMVSLRGTKAVQMAVFQVLKVFIPNPYKADPIVKVLTQNKNNMIFFLNEFEKDSKDEILNAHKKEMIDALNSLGMTQESNNNNNNNTPTTTTTNNNENRENVQSVANAQSSSISSSSNASLSYSISNSPVTKPLQAPN